MTPLRTYFYLCAGELSTPISSLSPAFTLGSVAVLGLLQKGWVTKEGLYLLLHYATIKYIK